MVMNSRPVVPRTAKIGGALYVVWGVFHAAGGAAFLYNLTVLSGTTAIAASGFPVENPSAQSLGIASALLRQHAWNLIWIGLFAAVVAVKMNWKNSPLGYWLNLGVVSAADLGLIFAILVPGYVSSATALAGALLGPLFWVLAAVFTSLAIRASQRPKL